MANQNKKRTVIMSVVFAVLVLPEIWLLLLAVFPRSASPSTPVWEISLYSAEFAEFALLFLLWGTYIFIKPIITTIVFRKDRVFLWTLPAAYVLLAIVSFLGVRGDSSILVASFLPLAFWSVCCVFISMFIATMRKKVAVRKAKAMQAENK